MRVSRIFLSHQHEDSRVAVALKQWLAEQDPPLAHEIFLDLDRHTGIAAGTRWKSELLKAKSRCEAVICVLSKAWAAAVECQLEFRNAEDMGKRIICASLEASTADLLTRDWQRIDLLGDGEKTEIDIGDGGPPVVLRSDALYRLRDAIRGAGISAESFLWPPPGEPDRAPYRGWDPLEERDAGIFFGRDAELVLALDALREMRKKGYETLFVVLGPSGSGKSSFLRAGILPRVRSEDRHYLVLDIVRPERRAMSGKTGFANSLYQTRRQLGLEQPSLGEIKAACTTDWARVRDLLAECRRVAVVRIPGADSDLEPPNMVLAIDQAEELFSADSGPEAAAFLELIAELADCDAGVGLGLIVAATIRTDRYDVMQTVPSLAKLRTRLFGELKPMPAYEFRDVIAGPASRFSQEVHQLRIEPALLNQLVQDCQAGAEALPLLALTLARLFEDYGSADELTLAQYRKMGGLGQIVQTQIDEVLSTDPALRADQLAALQAAFIPWLVTINADNDQPMRRVSRRSDLPAASLPLIDAMVDKRLLIQDRREGDVVVEVALESLLRQWDQLSEWLSEERETLTAADDLERAAKAWDEHQRDQAWLLEGARLASAETVVADPRFGQRLAHTVDYLRTSRQREDSRLEAERQHDHEAIARELVAQARAILARTGPGTDIKAFQLLLAARALQAEPDDGPIRDAVLARASTVKIIDSQGDGVRALAFSAQARQLAIASGRGAIWLRDAYTGETVGDSLAVHPNGVVAFSPDLRRIASMGADFCVQLWDAETGRALGAPLEGHTTGVNCVAFSPDGQRVATASWDGTVRLWDAHTGRSLGEPLAGHTDGVHEVAFSRDGQRLASASQDETVRLWDAHTGRPIGAPLTGHTHGVLSVAFSPDGQRLVTSSFDKTARLWDTRTGLPLGQPIAGFPDVVFDVAFSPDGHQIAAACADRTVRLWDADTGHAQVEPLIGHTDRVHEVAFSPDGHRLASSSRDGTVRLWDAHTGQVRNTCLVGHTDIVNCVAFSPDGQRIASASDDGTARLWDADTGHALGEPLTGHTDDVKSVAFSPDGQRLVTSSWDETLRIWDADTGRALGEPLTGHDFWVNCVAFSPDGLRLASGSEDKTVRLWDARTGEPLGEPLTGHTDTVNCVAFSPDGKWLASASDDHTVRLWDAHTGEPLGEHVTGHTGNVNGVAFSPDGQRLATAGGNSQGRRKGSKIHDNTVRLWDSRTGEPRGETDFDHAQRVTSVAFSPDGRRLASASDDKTVRLWDARTGEPLGEPLTGHTHRVNSVAFSPDGQRLASAGDDYTVRIWPGAAYPEMLCAKLATNMSKKQWNEWVSPELEYIPVCADLPDPPDDDS